MSDLGEDGRESTEPRSWSRKRGTGQHGALGPLRPGLSEKQQTEMEGWMTVLKLDLKQYEGSGPPDSIGPTGAVASISQPQSVHWGGAPYQGELSQTRLSAPHVNCVRPDTLPPLKAFDSAEPPSPPTLPRFDPDLSKPLLMGHRDGEWISGHAAVPHSADADSLNYQGGTTRPSALISSPEGLRVKTLQRLAGLGRPADDFTAPVSPALPAPSEVVPINVPLYRPDAETLMEWRQLFSTRYHIENSRERSAQRKAVCDKLHGLVKSAMLFDAHYQAPYSDPSNQFVPSSLADGSSQCWLGGILFTSWPKGPDGIDGLTVSSTDGKCYFPFCEEEAYLSEKKVLHGRGDFKMSCEEHIDTNQSFRGTRLCFPCLVESGRSVRAFRVRSKKGEGITISRCQGHIPLGDVADRNLFFDQETKRFVPRQPGRVLSSTPGNADAPNISRG